MKALQRRLDALDQGGRYLTLGDLLDSLDGQPLPEGRSIDPALGAALATIAED